MKTSAKIFWILFLINFLMTMGGNGVFTFFPILLSQMGFDYSAIGILLSLPRAIGAILQVFIGALIDRQNNLQRKRTLSLSNLLLAFSLLTIFFSDNPILFVATMLVFGVFNMIAPTISNTVVSSLIPKDRRSEKMGLFRASVSFGVSLGGIIMGTVVNFYGLRRIFVLSFLLYLVSLIAILFSDFNVIDDERKESSGEASQEIGGLISLNFALYLLVWTLISMITWADNLYIPLFIVEKSIQAGLAGIVMGVGALIEVPVFILIGKLCDIKNERKIMAIGSLLFTFVYILIMHAQTFPQFFVIQMTRGFAFGFFGAAALSFVAKIDPKRTGKAFGFYFLCLNLSGVVGPVISGFVSNIVGLKYLFLFHSLISALAFFLGAVIYLNSVKHQDH